MTGRNGLKDDMPKHLVDILHLSMVLISMLQNLEEGGEEDIVQDWATVICVTCPVICITLVMSKIEQSICFKPCDITHSYDI